VKRYYLNPITVRTVSTKRSQVITMFDALIRGTVPRTIMKAFREDGLVPYKESGVVYFRVDKTAAKKVRHWGDERHVEEGMGPAGKG
jgi:RNA binding exosome subunit